MRFSQYLPHNEQQRVVLKQKWAEEQRRVDNLVVDGMGSSDNSAFERMGSENMPL